MKSFLNFKTFLAIFFIAVVLFSCKKQEVELQNSSEDQKVEQRILNFKHDVEKPGLLKYNQTVSVEDAVWLVEAALNYSYCYITEEKSKGAETEELKDSVVFDIDIKNNLVDYKKVLESYLFYKQEVEKLNNNLSLDNKFIYLIDLESNGNQFYMKLILKQNSENTKSAKYLYNITGDWNGECI